MKSAKRDQQSQPRPCNTMPSTRRENEGERVFTFSVDDPMGAVRMTQRSKWVDPRAKLYAAYKRRVRLIANVAGVPDEIGKDERVKLVLDVCWRKKARADLDNVVKGIMDALWRSGHGGRNRGGERVLKLWLLIFALRVML